LNVELQELEIKYGKERKFDNQYFGNASTSLDEILHGFIAFSVPFEFDRIRASNLNQM